MNGFYRARGTFTVPSGNTAASRIVHAGSVRLPYFGHRQGTIKICGMTIYGPSAMEDMTVKAHFFGRALTTAEAGSADRALLMSDAMVESYGGDATIGMVQTHGGQKWAAKWLDDGERIFVPMQAQETPRNFGVDRLEFAALIETTAAINASAAHTAVLTVFFEGRQA